jgi:hypothetical protein
MPKGMRCDSPGEPGQADRNPEVSAAQSPSGNSMFAGAGYRVLSMASFPVAPCHALLHSRPPDKL